MIGCNNTPTESFVISSEYYISPKGNNSNSGITPSKPFKTINYVLNNFTDESIDSVKLYLLEGTYSPSSNGESFPLAIRSNISIVGNSKENVIIDPENTAAAFEINSSKNCIIKNLSIINGGNYWSDGGGLFIRSSKTSLRNIFISDCISHSGYGPTGGGIQIFDSDCDIDSVSVMNNRSGGLYIIDSNVKMTNSIVSNNSSDEVGCAIISDNCNPAILLFLDLAFNCLLVIHWLKRSGLTYSVPFSYNRQNESLSRISSLPPRDSAITSPFLLCCSKKKIYLSSNKARQ